MEELNQDFPGGPSSPYRFEWEGFIWFDILPKTPVPTPNPATPAGNHRNHFIYWQEGYDGYNGYSHRRDSEDMVTVI